MLRLIELDGRLPVEFPVDTDQICAFKVEGSVLGEESSTKYLQAGSPFRLVDGKQVEVGNCAEALHAVMKEVGETKCTSYKGYGDYGWYFVPELLYPECTAMIKDKMEEFRYN